MGKPNPLLSSFKLSYYTLLNLMRRLEGSGQDMEYVIKNSFQQFQFDSSLPEVSQLLIKLYLYVAYKPRLTARCRRNALWLTEGYTDFQMHPASQVKTPP